MTKPLTPSVWAESKSFGFQPSPAQQAQGFDYIATVRPSTGAPITDDHDWPLNQVTRAVKWMMDQFPTNGIKGVGAGQCPDMSFFSSANQWLKLPSGHIVQCFQAQAGQAGQSYVSNYPIPFPNQSIAFAALPITGDATVNVTSQGGTASTISLASSYPSSTVTCRVIAVGY